MIFYVILFFIIGSAIGSFLNVVIDRTTHGESIMGRSYCDYCRVTLGTLDLIPIFSFVGLGAKCRHCKKPISWQYPAVEAVCGLLFVFSFLSLSQFGNLSTLNLILDFFLVSVLIVVAVIDLKFSLIPTTFVLFASLVFLVFNYFALMPAIFVDHVMAAFGASIFFAVIVFVTRGRGMGEGDIFLAFLIGMVLGLAGTVLALFLAFFSGAVVSLLLIAMRKKRFGQTVPFGPFLVFGLILAFFWSKPIIDWYLGTL